MAEAVPKCHKFAQEGCLKSRDYTACNVAISYCEQMLGESFAWVGKNP
jgi:cathepsin A (carboxypeptidase C)